MKENATVIYCDSIQNQIVNGQMIPNISNPISNITPYAVPGNYSFSIFVKVENIRCDERHILKIDILDTENKLVMESPNIDISKDTMMIVNEFYAPITVSMDLRNVVIQSLGYFTTKVYLDGKELASQSLNVLKS